MGMGVLFEVMKIFWNETMLMVAQLCEYAKNPCIIHFKNVNFVWCKLDLNKTVIFFKGGGEERERGVKGDTKALGSTQLRQGR